MLNTFGVDTERANAKLDSAACEVDGLGEFADEDTHLRPPPIGIGELTAYGSVQAII